MARKPALTLHRLELFLSVLEAGGVSRAARARNISQPAVSEHLKGLEHFFGVPLFERTGREVRPTPAATELEPHARKVIELLREAERATRGLKALERGTLRVGASTTPGTYLLPAVLGRFHAAHPTLRLQLLIDNSREIERRIASGQTDLGVIGDSPLIAEVAAEPWIADELVLIVSRRHRLARRRSIEPGILTRERYIAREPGSSTRETAERYLSRRGVQLVPEMELGSSEAVREAVAAGLGVALISRLAVKDRAVVPIRIAGPRWSRDLLVIRRAGVPLSPAADRFRALLLAARP